MLLVNNPGSWDHIYGPLQHAAWHGWTPTDLIFPFFLFIMGSALAFSLRRHLADPDMPRGVVFRRVVKRVVLLVLLGLLLSGFPSYNIHTIRLPGVLQRIGLVYALAVPVVLLLRPTARFVLSFAILGGYWAVLVAVPVEGVAPAMDPARNLGRSIDLSVLGEAHLYRGSPTDPEGLLGTLPALVTCLMGYWAGAFVRDRARTTATAARLGIAGLLLAAVGIVLGEFVPINKPLWTPSYVVLTGGLAMACLSVCLWWVDVKRLRGKTRPFELIGLNAIVIFVGAGLMSRLNGMIRVGGGGEAPRAKAWVFGVLTDFGAPAAAASLGMALVFVIFWLGVAWAMGKRGWIVRV